jgi:hypothetical protein
VRTIGSIDENGVAREARLAMRRAAYARRRAIEDNISWEAYLATRRKAHTKMMADNQTREDMLLHYLGHKDKHVSIAAHCIGAMNNYLLHLGETQNLDHVVYTRWIFFY